MTEDSAINNHYQIINDHYQMSKKAYKTSSERGQDVTQPLVKKNLIISNFIG